MWDLQTRHILLPKLGHEASECEDAIAVDPQTCRFAVADGATEAFDARNWAQRLAEHWVRNESASTPEEFRQWVASEGRELQDSWEGLSLSWYSEEKARNGSFAAFVGVELDLESDSPSWKAIALGDACLFHSRRGELLKSFPLSKSENFNTAPVLVASDSSLHEAAMQSLVVASGSCQSGDVLLLASDGVAAWYLQQLENNDRKPDDLLKTKQNEELSQFFNDERATGRMRNDDVGVVRIEIMQRRTQLKE
jgi:Protein phosphatase 2C